MDGDIVISIEGIVDGSKEGCSEGILEIVGLIDGSSESSDTSTLDGDIVISIEGIVDASTEGSSLVETFFSLTTMAAVGVIEGAVVSSAAVVGYEDTILFDS